MFKQFGGDISDKVKGFEKKFDLQLPNDYKKFLIKTNGGQFVDVVHTFFVDELKQDIGIDALFGFDNLRSLCLSSWQEEYLDELPENTVIIGNSINAGLILLIWKEEWKGIFLWDSSLELEQSTEEDCLYRIADQFDLFFEALEDIGHERNAYRKN